MELRAQVNGCRVMDRDCISKHHDQDDHSKYRKGYHYRNLHFAFLSDHDTSPFPSLILGSTITLNISESVFATMYVSATIRIYPWITG